MMHTQLMKYGILWIILFLVFSFNGFLGAQELKILALGDSLTEGYGVEKEEAYPHLLEETLREKGTLYLKGTQHQPCHHGGLNGGLLRQL